MRNKVNVCFFNFVYAEGHIRNDTSFIEAISELCDVVCISPVDWYAFEAKNIIKREVVEELKLALRFPRLQYIFSAFRNIKRAAHIINHENFDIIVIGESEVLAFPFYMVMCGRHNVRKTIVVHHNDIDSADSRNILNKLRRGIFNVYKNKIVNCVLEPFIKESLISEYNISADRIVCWVHSLPGCQTRAKIGWDCLGISHSNDESMILELIEKENRYKVFKNAGLHILLRSKEIEYDDGYLKVELASKKYNDEEYKELYETAKVIFLPLPKTFNNRVSGTVYDALAAEIPIIASDIPFIQYCRKTYGDICRIYEVESFVDDIKNLSNRDERRVEGFKCFSDEHSKWQLLSGIQDAFDLILGDQDEKDSYK